MSGEISREKRDSTERDTLSDNDLKLLRMNADISKFTAKLDFAKYLIKFVFLFFLFAGIFVDFYFLLQAKPDALSGVAKVVKAVKLPQIFWGVALLLGYGWGWAEHSRHKRLTKQLGDLRRWKESGDHPFDTRSGLDAYGTSKDD